MNTPEEIDLHIGRRIRLARQSRRRSQIVTATLIGVSQQTLERYETGREVAPAQHLFELGECLNVRMAYFFGHD